jgi:predicted aconitase with swiveling domain
MSASLSGTVLNPGSACAPVLLLDEPLSFWGGFDPATGIILDRHHPQAGVCAQDSILILPAVRGSGGTPACVAESIRRGVGPAGVILKTADINIATGTLVAATLYDRHCPVVCVAADDYETLQQARRLTITPDGTIIIEQQET